MKTVIGVKFRGGSKVYYFDPGDLEIQTGDGVIVETARGVEFGDVAQGPHQVEEDKILAPLKTVQRVATPGTGKCGTRTRPRKKGRISYACKRYRSGGWK